jgi:prepilin-type N-terminal cleavage/methylation domain-containing protein
MRSDIDLTARPGRRPGFTLIELLVVIALIGILASLAISGVVKLRAAQMKSFTETTVNKLASGLDTLWKASLDDIKQDQPDLTRMTPAGDMSGHDVRRARVIYTKMRMKARFPVSFAEALSPDPISIDPRIAIVPPEPAFARELAGVNAAAVSADMQSSILLFLSMTQARRGMAAFKPEEVDPTAISTVNVPLTNGQSKTMSYFKDSWDNPIRLYTYPTGNAELQGPPYVNQNPSASPIARDPLDPEGTLYASDWPLAFRAQFIQRVHWIQLPSAQTVATARYLAPVIASAGPDGKWGLVDDQKMTMTQDGSGADGDNIYSYRLRRAGQRGD